MKTLIPPLFPPFLHKSFTLIRSNIHPHLTFHLLYISKSLHTHLFSLQTLSPIILPKAWRKIQIMRGKRKLSVILPEKLMYKEIHTKEDTISLTEFLSCPLAISCFRHHSCYELVLLFVTHLHNGQVNLDGVSFTLLPTTISEETCIPNIGEQWNKG